MTDDIKKLRYPMIKRLGLRIETVFPDAEPRNMRDSWGVVRADDLEKLLSHSPVVKCAQNGDSLDEDVQTWQNSSHTIYAAKATHAALLVGVESIVEDTAESLLREIFERAHAGRFEADWLARASKVLGAK